jgi:GNAT superfamily N-acetyltransferase
VAPGCQGENIGRLCIEEACRIALTWPAQFIRLDAYNAPAGAGAFYAKGGFRQVGRTTYRKVALIYFEIHI